MTRDIGVIVAVGALLSVVGQLVLAIVHKSKRDIAFEVDARQSPATIEQIRELITKLNRRAFWEQLFVNFAFFILGAVASTFSSFMTDIFAKVMTLLPF